MKREQKRQWRLLKIELGWAVFLKRAICAISGEVFSSKEIFPESEKLYPTLVIRLVVILSATVDVILSIFL